MSDFTGPGRNSEMSMMMSSKFSGPNLPISSRWRATRSGSSRVWAWATVDWSTEGGQRVYVGYLFGPAGAFDLGQTVGD